MGTWNEEKAKAWREAHREELAAKARARYEAKKAERLGQAAEGAGGRPEEPEEPATPDTEAEEAATPDTEETPATESSEGEGTVKFQVVIDGIPYACTPGEDGCEGCAFCLPFGRRLICAIAGQDDVEAARHICGALAGQWHQED